MTELGLTLIASFIASGRTAPAVQMPKSGTDISTRHHARDPCPVNGVLAEGLTIHVNEYGSAVR